MQGHVIKNKGAERDTRLQAHLATRPHTDYSGICDQEQGGVRGSSRSFIVCQGIIKGKGLQALVHILYRILDTTRNVVL